MLDQFIISSVTVIPYDHLRSTAKFQLSILMDRYRSQTQMKKK